MANNNPLGDLLAGDESSWALEETQKKIEDLLSVYLQNNANKDTKNLEIIAKNISKITNNIKSIEDIQKTSKKSTKDELKYTQDINQTLNKLGISIDKQTKEFHDDLTEKKAKSILSVDPFFGKKNDNIVNKVFGVFESLFTSATNLVTGLLNLDKNFERFILALPIVGAALGSLTGFLSKTIDEYRQFIDIGQSFSGSMFTFSIMANKAGLDLESFGKIIVENSKLIAGIGGPQVLANTVNAIRKSSADLGLTMESLTELTADYFDQLKLTSRFERMNDFQRRISTERYIKELINMAAITGKSVKELSKEQRALATNTRRLAVEATLSGDELEKYQENMTALTSEVQRFPNEIGGMLVDMAATAKMFNGNFAVASDFGRQIASMESLRGAFDNVVSAMNTGGPADVRSAMSEFSNSLLNLSDVDQKRLELQASQNDTVAQQLIQAQAYLRRLNRVRDQELNSRIQELVDLGKTKEEARQQALNEIDRRNKTTQKFLELQEKLLSAFGKIRSTILETLVDSKIFDSVANVVTAVINSIKQLSESVIGFIRVMDWDKAFQGKTASELIDNFWAQLNEAISKMTGGEESASSLVDEFFNKIGEIITNVIEKIDWGKIFKSIVSGLAINIFSSIAGAIAGALAGAAAGASLGGFLGTFLGPIGTAIGALIGGALGFIMPDIVKYISNKLSSIFNFFSFGSNEENKKPEVSTPLVKKSTGAYGIIRSPINIQGDKTTAAVVAATESSAITFEQTNKNLENLLNEVKKQNQILVSILNSNEKSVKTEKEIVSQILRSGRLN